MRQDDGSQGDGIYVLMSEVDLRRRTEHAESYVVQRYLPAPLLLDGMKFDFRLYVLIASVEPLRVFRPSQPGAVKRPQRFPM